MKVPSKNFELVIYMQIDYCRRSRLLETNLYNAHDIRVGKDRYFLGGKRALTKIKWLFMLSSILRGPSSSANSPT